MAGSLEEVRLEFGHWRMGTIQISEESLKDMKVSFYGWLLTKSKTAFITVLENLYIRDSVAKQLHRLITEYNYTKNQQSNLNTDWIFFY